jgi:hypothetical protein
MDTIRFGLDTWIAVDAAGERAGGLVVQSAEEQEREQDCGAGQHRCAHQ